MSPTRLTKMDELNYVIQERNADLFRTLIQSNLIPYRVAIFKAIESGSSKLFNIVKMYHPEPNSDIELECLHAAFRGHSHIYENIWYNDEIEEFNPYIENMYLYNGRFDKVNLIEINMHDLLSPNTIPVFVCDYIANQAPNNSCLMTGVLLAYCIHNSNNYIQLKNNDNIFIMEIMLKYATQNDNQELKLFLLHQFKRTKKYTSYEYTKRKGCLQKERQYIRDNCNDDLTMYDHYLLKKPGDINYGKPLKVRGNVAHDIHPKNVCLTIDMFEWPYSTIDDVDEYFDQVIDHVNNAIDKEEIRL